MRKKAQEEMIGFGVIVLLVTIILVAFIGFSVNDSGEDFVDSYQVTSFMQAYLQYTSKCQEKDMGVVKNISIKDLIIECKRGRDCEDGTNSCEILNETSKKVIKESWQIKSGSPRTGYEFIVAGEEDVITQVDGGKKGNSAKGNRLPIPVSGEDIQAELVIHYNRTIS